VSVPEALQLAQESELDLVEVAPLANPPVCRIMDYRKWQYEEKQRAKESRKKASNVSVKEMKYRPKIGSGDFDTKTRKVAEFLSEGHKVKVTIMFRGREVFHPELGARILEHIAENVTDVGKIESQGRLDGRNMTMVLAPDKKKAPARRRDEQRAEPATDGERDNRPEQAPTTAPVAPAPTGSAAVTTDAATPAADLPKADAPNGDLPRAAALSAEPPTT
jgi:translation initiation factor IF-3